MGSVIYDGLGVINAIISFLQRYDKHKHLNELHLFMR